MSPLPFTYSLVKLSTFLLAIADPFFSAWESLIQQAPKIILIHIIFILQQNGFQGIVYIQFFFNVCDMFCGCIQKRETDWDGEWGGEYKQNARKWKRHLNSDSGPSVFPTQQFEAVSWVTLSPCRHRIINFLMTERKKKKLLSLNRNILRAKTWIPVKSALFLCEIHGVSASCHVLPASFNKQSPLGRLLNQCSPKLTISF